MDEYFDRLRNLGQKIDRDIKKLEKTWESPIFFMSGCSNNVEEAGPYIEALHGTLKEIQNELIENQDSRSKYIKSTEEFLSHVAKFHGDLKQQFEDVEMLLSESGYHPFPESPEHSFKTESELESSILTPEQMGDTTSSSVFLSPGESKVPDKFITLRNQPKSIATPVIKSLASVIQSKQ